MSKTNAMYQDVQLSDHYLLGWEAYEAGRSEPLTQLTAEGRAQWNTGWRDAQIMDTAP